MNKNIIMVKYRKQTSIPTASTTSATLTTSTALTLRSLALTLSLLLLWGISSTKAQEYPKSQSYYIGDPCYALTNGWDNIVDQITREKKETLTITNSSGNTFLIKIFQLEDGDGSYSSTFKEEIPIDSGTIGCIPMAYWEDNYPEELDSLGIIQQINIKNVKKTDDCIMFDNIKIDLSKDYSETTENTD